MTLEEAKALAKEVTDGKSRSYVQAAHAFATFVSSLPTPPSLDGKIIGTVEGACKLVPVAEYEALLANQRPPECNACVSAGIDTCDHVPDVPRVASDREHIIDVPSHMMDRLRSWMKAPNGSLCLLPRLTIEAVDHGGILVRSQPYRSPA